MVADNRDDSVLIIDISDPDRPDIVFGAYDKEDGFALDGPVAVDMALIGESKYVLVVTRGTYDRDNGTITGVGLQLIDVTDPLEPTAGGRVVGAQEGDFALINVVDDVSAVQIGDQHYALVASGNANSQVGSLVIVNITNPRQPLPRLERARRLGPTSKRACRWDILRAHRRPPLRGGPY